MADTKLLTRPENPSSTDRTGHEPAVLRRITKYVSYVLRHGPDTVGVTMDGNGWVDVDELIERSDGHHRLSRPLIDQLVATDEKQRFALSDDGRRIRARHGHSVEVDLGLKPRRPPANLYHGTGVFNVQPILERGLLPLGRVHVHLSDDRQAAATVAGPLESPMVLTIDAAAMAADGHQFLLSENGIWLSGPIPPKYLTSVD